VSPEGFEDATLAVIRSIPSGAAMTYGEVAAEAGHPGAARAVGRLLAHTGEDLPWWRVVGSGGRIRSPAADRQAAILAREGWVVRNGRISNGASGTPGMDG
jgi:methylated-DNA-protein-cysteine methyltransferase related protein